MQKQESFTLSALNSENKPAASFGVTAPPKSSFMTKLSSQAPLVKDVSFGGPQSIGVFSGLPSTGTAKNKQDIASVFPATA